MSRGQTRSLPLKAAYAFGAAHGLEEEVKAIREMLIDWDSSYTSSLRRGYIVDLLEEHGLLDEFKTESWQYGNTPPGEAKRSLYLKIKQKYEKFLNDRSVATSIDVGDQADERQFAAESDLRDFLANNLGCIESGLRLHQADGRNGVEYPIAGGFIDILAVDSTNRFVVIELKVGSGRNKAVGQLLYYMGWVDQNLGNAPCRGIIIAKDVSDALVLAIKRVPDVVAYRYKLSVTVEPVMPTL